MSEELILLTFPSTHWALKAEKAVLDAGRQGRLIPMPRQISSLCGLALELPLPAAPGAIALLREKGIRVEKVVKAVRERGLISVTGDAGNDYSLS